MNIEHHSINSQNEYRGRAIEFSVSPAEKRGDRVFFSRGGFRCVLMFKI